MNKIILITLGLALQGCAHYIKPKKPLYGPHNTTTMTNREWDIERRNLYSDGWQDAVEAMRKYE